MATKLSSNFPNERTANRAKGKEQLPVTSQTLLKSNGVHLAIKLKGLEKPNWDLEPRHNSEWSVMLQRHKHDR